MPANSGSISGTVAHRHSVPSGDGGQLAEGVTNITGGALNEVLTNDGTDVPIWAPAGGGGGGGNYVFLESFTAAAASTFTCTLASPIDIADFSQLVGVFNGAFGIGACELQLANNLATPLTSTHYESWFTVAGDAAVNDSSTDNFRVGAPVVADHVSRCQIVFYLTVNPVQGAGSGKPSDMHVYWFQNGTFIYANGGGYTYNNSGNISTIDGFYFTNSLGNNFTAGSTLDVFKVST